ncbi:PLP-dependent transferase [Thermus antranikianii]|uniref:Uncharacterized protein n=1 Tax=Thermus antranikianii TaxID=88190 RepID=A0ABY7RPI8_9DEIN|nr:PLP-dependent transferase [Thermus antranikianii]WCM39609.1 hypothetical protein GO600_05605 [Thermus antranikianii]
MRSKTLQPHGGYESGPTILSHPVPIRSTPSYLFQNPEHAANPFAPKGFGIIHSRVRNPTAGMREGCLVALEGGKAALATSSGPTDQSPALTIHPASTTHSQPPLEEQTPAGVLPEMVRLRAGLGRVDDPKAELKEALA